MAVMDIVVWIALEDDPKKFPEYVSATLIELQNHIEEFFMDQLELASVVTAKLDND